MRIPKRFLLSAFIALSFASSPLVEAQTHEDTDWNIRVGIQRFHDDENFAKAISTVIKAVQEVFGAGLNVVFIPMNEKEIREAAKKKYAEILLTDATLSRVVDADGFKAVAEGYRQTEYPERLLLLPNSLCQAPFTFEKQNVILPSLPDVETLPIFNWYLEQNGLEPLDANNKLSDAQSVSAMLRNLKQEKNTIGLPKPEWIPLLRNSTDVCLRPYSWLLGKKKEEHAPLVIPNLVVNLSSALGTQNSNDLVRALLNSTNKEVVWSAQNKFDELDSYLKSRKEGPYEYLRYWTFQRIINEYPIAITIGVCCLLWLIIFALYVHRLVKFRTAQLTRSLKLQSKYQTSYEKAKYRAETLERIQILNRVSGILVHELKQPLNALKLFVYALGQSNSSDSQINQKEVLSRIETAAGEIDAIIKEANSFIEKGRNSKKLSLQRIVERNLTRLCMLCECPPKITKSYQDECVLFADPFELELIINNLLKNAFEAVKESPNALVKVSLTNNENTVNVLIEDNGKGMPKETMERLSQRSYVSDILGIGLGLMLVREALWRSNGEISFQKGGKGGLLVSISFPKG